MCVCVFGVCSSNVRVHVCVFARVVWVLRLRVSDLAGRYRLQSNQIEVMWLLSSALIERLTRFYATDAGAGTKSLPTCEGDGRHGAVENGRVVSDTHQHRVRVSRPSSRAPLFLSDLHAAGEGPFTVSFNEELPLAPYFDLIDAHFTQRLAIVEHRATLEALAHQFRSVQKRLLARFKDKNPAPLKQLDTLLDDTHEQLSACADRMSAAQQVRQWCVCMCVCICIVASL